MEYLDHRFLAILPSRLQPRKWIQCGKFLGDSSRPDRFGEYRDSRKDINPSFSSN